MTRSKVHSFRVHELLKDHLDLMASRTSDTRGEVIRHWILDEDLPTDPGGTFTIEQAIDEADRDEAAPEGLLISPCPRCGEDVIVDLAEDSGFFEEAQLVFSGWIHEDCNIGRGATDDERLFESILQKDGELKPVSSEILGRSDGSVPISLRLSRAEGRALRSRTRKGKKAVHSHLSRYLCRQENLLDAKEASLYSDAYRDAATGGKGRILAMRCFACGEPMIIDLVANDRAAKVLREVTCNWAHRGCPQTPTEFRCARRRAGRIEGAAAGEAFAPIDPKLGAARLRPLSQDYPILGEFPSGWPSRMLRDSLHPRA